MTTPITVTLLNNESRNLKANLTSTICLEPMNMKNTKKNMKAGISLITTINRSTLRIVWTQISYFLMRMKNLNLNSNSNNSIINLIPLVLLIAMNSIYSKKTTTAVIVMNKQMVVTLIAE